MTKLQAPLAFSSGTLYDRTEPLQRADVRQELNVLVAQLLPAFCWVLAGLYAFFALTQLVTQDQAALPQQTGIWASTSAGFALAALLQRARPVPARWAHHAFAATSVPVLFNSLRLIGLGGPAFSPILLLVMLGYATLVLSIPWIVGFVVVCALAWAAVARSSPADPAWEAMAFLIISGGAIAILTATLRLNAMKRLVELRLGERHAAEERQQQLEQTLRAQLINTAAHELATPLTPITINLYALRQAPNITSEQRHSIDVIENNLRRLNLVVQNIHEYAQPQSQPTVTRAPTDLARLVHAAVEAVDARCRQAGIDLEPHLPQTLPATADAQRLRLAIDQVLDNAIKFTPRGGRVLVELVQREGSAALVVEDTGPGIPAQVLANIFEPLARAGPVHTRSGAQLGLYVARRILQAHEGSLDVQSEAGRGTRVTLRLPTPQTN